MKPKQYLVIITGDSNDADYVDRVTFVEETRLPLIKKVAAVLQEHGKKLTHGGWTQPNHNWLTGERAANHWAGEKPPLEVYKRWLTAAETQEFEDSFVPYVEYGLHTICSITIIEVAAEEKLLQ